MCVKASACKRECVAQLLCVKASVRKCLTVCKSFPVSKLLYVKASVLMSSENKHH